jgi:hypothetical protein
MRHVLVAAIVVVFAITACGGHTLTGEISVFGDCHSPGYNDITAGAPVVVKDESGKILATGSLGSETSCRFPLTVDGIPDAKFYQVEVSHRGALTYSPSDLDQRGWKIELTLGS